MKLRNLAVGLALLTTGTVIGVTTQQLASADVSSGDRTVLVPIESCRLIDTRPAFQVGPRPVPLGPAETVTLDTQQDSTQCSGDIPTSATAIAANVTAPTATGKSFITLWANGPRPNSSTLNPQAGQLVFNAATIDLAANNTFRIYNNANNVHIIIDVIGYYENHDHDDRYYTKAEAEALFAPEVDSIPLGIMDFQAGDGINWNPGGLFWGQSATDDSNCLYARVAIPAGRSVASVDLTYFASGGPADLDVFVAGVNDGAGQSTITGLVNRHLAAGPTVPGTSGQTAVVSVVDDPSAFAGFPLVPVVDDRPAMLRLCTSDTFQLFTADVQLVPA